MFQGTDLRLLKYIVLEHIEKYIQEINSDYGFVSEQVRGSIYREFLKY